MPSSTISSLGMKVPSSHHREQPLPDLTSMKWLCNPFLKPHAIVAITTSWGSDSHKLILHWVKQPLLLSVLNLPLALMLQKRRKWFSKSTRSTPCIHLHMSRGKKWCLKRGRINDNAPNVLDSYLTGNVFQLFDHLAALFHTISSSSKSLRWGMILVVLF